MHNFTHRSPHGQRGAAALLVTTLLCFAMLLVVAYAHRNVVVEEHASANQLRAAQAFEAAEAGIEWALSRLNDPTPAGPDCRPGIDASARSARDRWLRFQGAAGDVVPATWSDAGTPTPLRAACVRDDGGWTCSCPASGAPSLAAPAGQATAPAFAVEFTAGPRPGIVRIAATGCTRGDAVCAGAADPTANNAVARVEASFALLPALRSAPVAALTTRGSVDAGTAALGVHHGDAASGTLALHAGGHVAASALRITAPAGASLEGTVAADDGALAALDADRFFARFFGMSVAAWAAQPAVTRVACSGDCTAAVGAAIAAGGRLLYIDGDATLAGPASFGAAGDPVALVGRGRLTLTGAVTVDGIVEAASLQWDAAAAGAAVRGAVLSAGHYRGDAAADFTHDSAVLALLATRAGSFVRINGSWKDF